MMRWLVDVDVYAIAEIFVGGRGEGFGLDSGVFIGERNQFAAFGVGIFEAKIDMHGGRVGDFGGDGKKLGEAHTIVIESEAGILRKEKAVGDTFFEIFVEILDGFWIEAVSVELFADGIRVSLEIFRFEVGGFEDAVHIIFDFFDTAAQGFIVSVGVIAKSNAASDLVWRESFFALASNEYSHFTISLML